MKWDKLHDVHLLLTYYSDLTQTSEEQPINFFKKWTKVFPAEQHNCCYSLHQLMVLMFWLIGVILYLLYPGNKFNGILDII